MFKGQEEAYLGFTVVDVSVTLRQSCSGGLCLGIFYRDTDPQPFSAAQIYGSLFPQALIHAVEHLYIKSGWSPLPWRRGTAQNSEWLDLLRSFSSVRCLYLTWQFGPRIAPILQELVGDRATEALPALQTLFLEEADLSWAGPVREAIGQFVAARRLVGHPVAVSSWEYKQGSND